MKVSAQTLRPLVIGLIILLLALMLGRFAVESYGRAVTNSNSANGDQGAFLQLGLSLREQGILTDGTRSPLYAVFLAAIAERDWGYFTRAKLLSIAFGLLTIAAIFFLGWRRFNLFTGLVAAYLLSINVEFIVHSATALTESLLVLLFTLAWFAMLWALDDPDRWGYWVLAGALVALAYLAKGSGQLLMIAFLVSALLLYRLDLLRTKSFWAFVAAYALTASPLWLYNTMTYGSPTFNYAISHQLWMEDWYDWHPDDTANLPTALSYLQSHTPAEIWERQWTGMKAQRNLLVKTLYPTRTLKVDNFLLSPLSGLMFVMVAALPLFFWRSSARFVKAQRGAVILTGLTLFIFFMLFAWYSQIILATRFMLPLAPPIFVMGAYLLSQIGASLARRGRWARLALAGVVTLILVMQAAWWLRTVQPPLEVFQTTNLFERDREFGQDAATPLAWLAEGYPGAVVAYGPSGQSLPAWAFSDRLDFELYPPGVDTIPSLTENFTRRGIEFIIVDADMVSRHKALLSDRFPSNGYAINVTGIPPAWALTYAYRGMPCDWCVFRLPASRPAQYPVDYQLGPGIRLTGYDLARSELRPGETVRLTLHWLADGDIEPDLTVFTQLLGPDWQLHGQLDRPPLNNRWPTSRWQPGDHLADRYDIPLSAEAPPGEYQLLVGMYDHQTGERLAVTQNGQPVPDNAIVLDTITILSNEE